MGTNGSRPTAQKKTRLKKSGWNYDDFYHLRTQGRFILAHDNGLWPAASVNKELPPHLTGQTNAQGNPVYISASAWLQEHRPVHQLIWSPGDPKVIEGRQLDNGGWIQTPGYRGYNLYQPPMPIQGDPSEATPWLDHIRLVYPDDASHIVKWFAHRVQRPHEKINHALVLGGRQGIGKDTMIEPVLRAVGPQNCHEITPTILIGRFNGFVRSVILRINEAHDLGGEMDRYGFYEHSKPFIAAPPFALRCDEKHLTETYVPNVMGVVITTNHKANGIYLPEDDRRHYVCWSEIDGSAFIRQGDEAGQPASYFSTLYAWFETGGYGHVGAYLRTLDLSDFNPQAPPPKTPAFWAIVDSNRPAEDAELADLLDKMANSDGQHPQVVTIERLITEARQSSEFDEIAKYLSARSNRRQIKSRMEHNRYVPIQNNDAKDGLWKINGRRQQVYAKVELTMKEQYRAVRQLIESQNVTE